MYRVNERISNLSLKNIEEMYAIIAEIDAVKGSWQLATHVVPQMISRLTQSVIITSTGSSNRR